MLKRLMILSTLISAMTVRAEVAYTVLSADKTTLTFYCDNDQENREEKVYPLNEGNKTPEWYAASSTITTVCFDASFAEARPTTTSKWFYSMTQLSRIEGIDYLNTSSVTDMSSMFWNCNNLTAVDLSGFVTSEVTDMRNMFRACNRLAAVDLSRFNTSKVVTMAAMFRGCSSLDSLELGNFNTSAVTDMSDMFYNCSNIKQLDLSGFETKAVTSMNNMFRNCSKLTNLNLGHFDTSNVMEMTSMFWGCGAITDLTISSTMTGLTSSALAGVGSESNPCNLHAPENFDFGVDTSNGRFQWKGGYFVLHGSIIPYAVLEGQCLTFYRDDQRETRQGTCYSLSTGNNIPEWYNLRSSIQKVVFMPSFADARPTTTMLWFYGMSSLTQIEGIEYLNTSKVTNMESMFSICSRLQTIDLSHFDTSSVTNMDYMFSDCSGLQKINLYNFNTQALRTAKNMFKGCESVSEMAISTSLTLPGENAMTDVGSPRYPCVMRAPASYDFGTDTTGTYYEWKGGYFQLNPFLPGDANHDERVTVVDAMLLVDEILENHPSVFFFDEADVNGDDTITVTDVMLIVDIILSWSGNDE